GIATYQSVAVIRAQQRSLGDLRRASLCPVACPEPRDGTRTKQPASGQVGQAMPLLLTADEDASPLEDCPPTGNLLVPPPPTGRAFPRSGRWRRPACQTRGRAVPPPWREGAPAGRGCAAPAGAPRHRGNAAPDAIRGERAGR